LDLQYNPLPTTPKGGKTVFAIGNIFNDIDSPFGSKQELKKISSNKELMEFLLDVQTYFARVSAANEMSSAFGGSYSSGAAISFGRSVLQIPQFQFALTLTDADMLEGVSNDASQSPDYSGTNIQVEGVDEADFIKNDGKYAYIISGNKLTIIEAYPPENAAIISKVALDIPQGYALQNMFLDGDRIVVFYPEYTEENVIPEYGYAPQTFSVPSTHAVIIDISDRENPEVIRNYQVSGDYSNSRMIGKQVYLLTTSGVDYQRPVMPSIKESTSSSSRMILTPDVYYFDNPEQYFVFNTVIAIDLDAVATGGESTDDDNGIVSKTFMMGSGTTVYVSENNIYIAYQQNQPYEYYQSHNRDKFFRVIAPLLPSGVQDQIESIERDSSFDPAEKWNRVSELLQDTYNSLPESRKNDLFAEIQNGLAEYDAAIIKESQKTVIHKISIGGDDALLNYVAKGEVPGRLLNQLSMDEYKGRFRVATTSEYSTPYQYVMNNNVYTLDENMEIVGKLEEIAADESIYAARFMGDRLYLVTFRQIDPFFVIDMSEDDPEVLGELKLPGYSSYLHPYDEDHVIAIGRETGVKFALFDVSDVRNPEAVDVYEIGGRGTDSEALSDHKAFLFDKEKDVISIPIYSYNDVDYSRPWSGFYVFGTDTADGFTLKGKVEHAIGDYGMWGSRSFYIEDALYTVTQGIMKVNSMDDIGNEINSIRLEGSGDLMGYIE
jgi:uncharacterized secreted protein with C-terminal beta-propeller domain